MEPILVIMAAGMGSRYGGLKQLDGIGPSGELIIDYSIYDAVRAGFKRFVFIIKEEHEKLFKEKIIDRLPRELEIKLAHQKIDEMPGNFIIPAERKKPWGTAHAVYSAKECIDAPFAVINSDDYYGSKAFELIYEFLKNVKANEEISEYAMVAFELGKTLTEKGSVSRGLCSVKDGKLEEVKEYTEIYKAGSGAYAFLKVSDFENNSDVEESKVKENLDPKMPVSMNFWAFDPSFIYRIEEELEYFMKNEVPKNPLKAECYLPTVVSKDIERKRAFVRVLRTDDHWLGVTYSEDRDRVKKGFEEMIKKGLYPDALWNK